MLPVGNLGTYLAKSAFGKRKIRATPFQALVKLAEAHNFLQVKIWSRASGSRDALAQAHATRANLLVLMSSVLHERFGNKGEWSTSGK